MDQNKLHRIANTIGLIIICSLLIVAFIDQLYEHDLPCPLCLLQRICFVGVGLSLCMNLKNGVKTSHYGLMMLSALLGFAIAMRQIYIHMAAGGGYGNLILGLYMYQWAAITFAIIIGLIAVALLFEQGFYESSKEIKRGKFILMIVFLILILANVISTFIECGFSACPANPINYLLFNRNFA